MPAFSFRHVKDLYPVFWAKSMEMMRAISVQVTAAGVTDVEVNGWASRDTLDIIGLAGSKCSQTACYYFTDVFNTKRIVQCAVSNVGSGLRFSSAVPTR